VRRIGDRDFSLITGMVEVCDKLFPPGKNSKRLFGLLTESIQSFRELGSGFVHCIQVALPLFGSKGEIRLGDSYDHSCFVE